MDYGLLVKTIIILGSIALLMAWGLNNAYWPNV